MTPISASSLSRRYTLVVTACALPLLLLIGALGAYQFDVQRRAAFETLGATALQTKLVVERIVQDASDHLIQLKFQAESLLSRDGPADGRDLRALLAPSYPPAAGSRADGLTLDEAQGSRPRSELGNIFLAGDRLAATLPGEVEMALALFEPMRLTHLVKPDLRWSYYFSASRAFITMFPFVPRGELIEGFGHDSIGAMVDAYMAYEIYRDVTPERNRDLSPMWSPPYLDAAGAGWMVTHSVPVMAGERFAGVLGTDLLLAYLDEALRQIPLKAGRLWVVDPAGNLIADRASTPIAGDSPRHIRSVIAPEVGAADTLLGKILVPGRHETSGHEFISMRLAGTPWTLLFNVSEEELDGIAGGQIVPYGIILVGLLVTIVAAHFILRSQFIRPAILLTEYLQAENAGVAAQPSAAAQWRPWFRRISAIFEENRKTIRELAESEQRYRDVVEAQTDFVLRMTPDGRLTFVNDAYCRYHGRSREELLNPDWCDLDVLSPSERERFLEHLARLTPEAPVASIELYNAFPGASVRWSAWTDRGIFDEEGRLIEVQSVGRDVTERVIAEQARQETERLLAEREAQFRAIAEGVPLSVIISAIEEPEIFFVNERAQQTLGLEVGQKGKSVVGVWKQPRHRFELTRRVEVEGVVNAYETTLMQSDGREMQALVSARRIEHQGRPAVLAAITDITRQREAEAELAVQREALHQSEKLTALGSLLAGVAHELNNPLSVVVGYSSMLQELSSDPAVTSRAEKIHAAAERCSRIVRTFLAMARKRPPSRGMVDLNKVVTAALELAAYGLRSAGVEISTELDPDLPAVWGDEDQLHQVMANLVINAQQALLTVAPPRRLTISTSRDGDMVEVVIVDNGPGIPEEVRTRIFEPFFTTKAAGVGTGVGLSVCRAIVTAHEGSIEVESEAGAGTGITVRLPPAGREKPAPETAGEQEGSTPIASANVLIVEDEADIAAMVAEILRQDGHVVEVAGDVQVALAIIERADIDLIVSDLRMPGLDGPGLYRAIQARRPELVERLLFITGDVLAADIDRFLTRTGALVIEKPLDPAAFRRAVAGRLAEMEGDVA